MSVTYKPKLENIVKLKNFLKIKQSKQITKDCYNKYKETKK